jgi:hypothetical protein
LIFKTCDWLGVGSLNTGFGGAGAEALIELPSDCLEPLGWLCNGFKSGLHSQGTNTL